MDEGISKKVVGLVDFSDKKIEIKYKFDPRCHFGRLWMDFCSLERIL